MIGGTSALLCAALIILPLGFLLAAPAPPAAADTARDVFALTLRSFALAAAIAAAAVLLGCLPGRVLGTASGRFQTALFFLVLAPLLLPRYLLYYAWALPLSPTAALGEWLGRHPAWARTAGTAVSTLVLVTWHWPLAALLIAQGWRNMDPDLLRGARLDATGRQRWTHVTLPLLARPMALAFAVCFAFALSEFGTFHLAGIRTVGTELAVLYELTGSAGAVARAAWPLALVALLAGLFLWRQAADWSVAPAVERLEDRGAAWQRWTVAALVVLSFGVPVALLALSADDASQFARFRTLHWDELAWSLAISAAAGAGALVIAAGAVALNELGAGARALAALLVVSSLVAMFLPGSVLAVALLQMLSALGAPAAVQQSWLLVSAGQAARFAGIVLIVFVLARDSRDRHLREMASVDGASWLAAWAHVHLPRVWPLLLAAFLVAVMLGMTELPATMVLLPAGLPSFSQRLLNQMHYARDQQVIASCLVLVGVYAALALAAAALLGMIRARAARSALLICLACLAAGCDSSAAPQARVRVLALIGTTGSGPGEFIYPRAIDLAHDGSLFVADKTGRIQHLAADGKCLGLFHMPEFQTGKPTGLTVGPDGNLYVADTHYHRVVVFAPDGRELRRFGSFGQAGGQFIYPTDVAFAADGRMFVSEYGGNDRVSIFSPTGEFLKSFGAPGSGPGQFARPAALCIDPGRGVLYVADACNHRIARYDLEGRLAGYWGEPGRAPGQFRYPYGLALLADGTLAVCEYGNNRIQLFDPAGASLMTAGGPGRESGSLAYPWAVAVDRAGRAYIVDAGNNRIQVWTW